MGYQDRDYMRNSSASGGYFYYDEPADTGYGRSRGWLPNLRELPATGMAVALFLIANAVWFGSDDSRPFLTRHFTLDAADAPDGRLHCYLTHALVYGDSLLQAGLMLAGLAVFGAACERRVGAWWTAGVMVAATVVGGWLHVSANTPGGAAGWAQAVEWVRGRCGEWLGGAAGELFARCRATTSWTSGPGAAVMALAAIGTLIRPEYGRRRENLWLALAAVAFVLIDCFGWLRAAGSEVAYGPRVAGLAVGAVAAVAVRLTVRRPDRREGWAKAVGAAVLTYALPAAAAVVASAPHPANPFAPPAFAADDFHRTCGWMERVSRPVESGATEVNRLKRQEEVDRVTAEVGGVTDRPVRWELSLTAVTDREIRLTSLYLADGRTVRPVPLDPDNPFAFFAQMEETGDRLFTDVRVQLVHDGHDRLAVPLTDELKGYARTLTADSRVRVRATVRRIEFYAPGGQNPFEALFAGRCGFVVHLSDLTLDR